MSLRGSDLLNLASSLLANSVASVADEARWRAVVGRAYYAAYLEIREALRPFRGEVKIDEYASHAKVRTLLAESGVKDCDTYAAMLAQLHTRRQQADYNLKDTKVGSNAAAEKAVADARELIQYAELLVGSERRALFDGLRTYLKKTNQIGRNFPPNA